MAKKDDWDILKNATKKDSVNYLEPSPSIFEGVGKQLENSSKRIQDKMKNPQEPEEVEEIEVSDSKTSSDISDIVDEDFLGKKVVTIKKILGKKSNLAGKEVYTAIIESNGEELLAGIDPNYLDANKIQEGDTAVYNEPFLVSIVDSATPLVKIPKVSFEVTEEVSKDQTIQVVGGLEEQIKELKEALEVFNPKKRKEMMDFGIIPVRGILLYGPSGTGKTMLAKASANYAKVPFFYINTPELFKCHLGETVQEIKRAFNTTRKYAPSVLYLDEVTRLAANRSYRDGGAEKEVAGATEEFQAQMNGLHDNGAGDDYIMVIGSTNLADVFDPAVLGRFDIHIQVPTPDYETIKKIIHTKVDRVNHDTNLSIEAIASKLNSINPKATGRDIENISNKAKRLAYRRGEALSNKDFDESLELYSKRVDILLRRGP